MFRITKKIGRILVAQADIFKPPTNDDLKQRREDYKGIFLEEVVTSLISHGSPGADGRLNIRNTVFLSDLHLTKLPLRFGDVFGNFYCNDNNLIDLEGAPEYVAGLFNCSHNQLTTLAGGPLVSGCAKNKSGGFYCSYNNLSNFIGAPKYIAGFFECYHNPLTSLEGAPKRVDGHVFCSKGFTEEEWRRVSDITGKIMFKRD